MTLKFTTRIPITATNPKFKFLLLQNKQKMPADNLAVWRNGGTNPAEKAVRK